MVHPILESWDQMQSERKWAERLKIAQEPQKWPQIRSAKFIGATCIPLNEIIFLDLQALFCLWTHNFWWVIHITFLDFKHSFVQFYQKCSKTCFWFLILIIEKNGILLFALALLGWRPGHCQASWFNSLNLNFVPPHCLKCTKGEICRANSAIFSRIK